ncbi:catechol 2,3-dioxygenase-like lactoylglutathione lyase family enzyme [Algoriphagus sp. 4150]|uniref:VOC family protein n=1 Tax=Algoriphagus sp. 4150 TaxID=2817756 RepID=UPI00285C52EC|nr:VOC family protein [Algoriphagus sp. 4150]MDR7131495.1 catechol 2,3-dioxygenase-like lactoylglutathione lyase family enzyme [Algoriphagus sp. 4150]
MITKAIQITILVNDVDEAKNYYVDKLGFSVVNDMVFSSDWRYLTVAPQKDNATVFELLKAETPEQKKQVGHQAGGQVLVMFESDNIIDDYNRMKAKGVVFNGEPSEVPEGKGVGFKDLYGNQFDLYQPD